MGDPNPFVHHGSPYQPTPPQPCVLPPVDRRKPAHIAVETEYFDEKQQLDEHDEPYYKSASQSSSEFMMKPSNGSISYPLSVDLEKAGLDTNSYGNNTSSSINHSHSNSRREQQNKRLSTPRSQRSSPPRRSHHSNPSSRHSHHSHHSNSNNHQHRSTTANSKHHQQPHHSEMVQIQHQQQPQRIIHNSTTRPADPSLLQPEEASLNPQNPYSPSNSNSNPRALEAGASSSYQPGRAAQEAHAVRILLFLSGPVVFLSLINTLWTFIAVVITTLTQPVRICARRPSISQQLAGLLGPALNLQLRAIYTPLPPYADEDGEYHALRLLGVLVLSPVVAMAVAVAGWVCAVYWLSSAVVGDPGGLDKRDDGRETVLGLRGWWEGWCGKCVKEQN